jgi:hypothetical protein
MSGLYWIEGAIAVAVGMFGGVGWGKYHNLRAKLKSTKPSENQISSTQIITDPKDKI